MEVSYEVRNDFKLTALASQLNYSAGERNIATPLIYLDLLEETPSNLAFSSPKEHTKAAQDAVRLLDVLAGLSRNVVKHTP